MLHERLKLMRKKKGLTQEELATHLNVTRQTISKWEKGVTNLVITTLAGKNY